MASLEHFVAVLVALVWVGCASAEVHREYLRALTLPAKDRDSNSRSLRGGGVITETTNATSDPSFFTAIRPFSVLSLREVEKMLVQVVERKKPSLKKQLKKLKNLELEEYAAALKIAGILIFNNVFYEIDMTNKRALRVAKRLSKNQLFVVMYLLEMNYNIVKSLTEKTMSKTALLGLIESLLSSQTIITSQWESLSREDLLLELKRLYIPVKLYKLFLKLNLKQLQAVIFFLRFHDNTGIDQKPFLQTLKVMDHKLLHLIYQLVTKKSRGAYMKSSLSWDNSRLISAITAAYPKVIPASDRPLGEQAPPKDGPPDDAKDLETPDPAVNDSSEPDSSTEEEPDSPESSDSSEESQPRTRKPPNKRPKKTTTTTTQKPTTKKRREPVISITTAIAEGSPEDPDTNEPVSPADLIKRIEQNHIIISTSTRWKDTLKCKTSMKKMLDDIKSIVQKWTSGCSQEE